MRTKIIAVIATLTPLIASAAPPVATHVYSVPPQNLALAKQQVSAHDPAIAGAFAGLIARANNALGQKPTSVMDKTGTAASGDKHDYYSLAPYWWPEGSGTGVHYIKRDGYVNPDSRKGTDSVAFANLCSNVETLGLAYYFTEKEAYAEKAAALIRVWFLDAATAMTPRANYGQAIPGQSNGRLEGLIELRHLTRITDAIALIENSPAWRPQDQNGFKTWLTAYYDWLQHNDLKGEDTSNENNHLTWRDVQVVQLGMVLGKEADARAFLQNEFAHLLTAQIKRNGEQPRELVRTNSLGYSLFNLEAMLRLATLGEYLGVDCWSMHATKSANLCTALDALAPYIDSAKPWPVKEVKSAERWRLLPMLAQAYQHTKAATYHDLLLRFNGQGDNSWCLWWAPAVTSGS